MDNILNTGRKSGVVKSLENCKVYEGKAIKVYYEIIKTEASLIKELIEFCPDVTECVNILWVSDIEEQEENIRKSVAFNLEFEGFLGQKQFRDKAIITEPGYDRTKNYVFRALNNSMTPEVKNSYAYQMLFFESHRFKNTGIITPFGTYAYILIRPLVENYIFALIKDEYIM